jgi:RNA polymerase sigma-70 factor (ECF subfamily)
VQTLAEQATVPTRETDDLFAELQARLEPQIRRFVRRLLSGSAVESAEDDIVQDVFISLYRNLHRIQPIENIRPYTFGIARKRCYTELRRQRRSHTDSPSLEVFEMIPDASVPHDEATHLLMLSLEVREAIDRLPELQRQTLILYTEEELSYVEIAQAMNTTVGTVKSRIHYAKRALRGLLKPATLDAIEGEFSHE